jgi:hypothetical protein
MGEDELLQAGQVSETVVKNLDKGLFEGLRRRGSLQVQKPTQGSHAPAAGTLFELPEKPIEPFIRPEKGLLLHIGPFVGSLPVKRRMVSDGSDPGLPFIQEPQMIGNLLVLEKNLHPLSELMDLRILTNQSFRHRVAIGIDLHIPRHINGSIQCLIDGRHIGR